LKVLAEQPFASVAQEVAQGIVDAPQATSASTTAMPTPAWSKTASNNVDASTSGAGACFTGSDGRATLGDAGCTVAIPTG
jgi:hypothetical protein